VRVPRPPASGLHARGRAFLVDDQVRGEGILAPSRMRIPVEALATTVLAVPAEGGLGVSGRVGIAQGWTATARERGEEAERERHAGHA